MRSGPSSYWTGAFNPRKTDTALTGSATMIEYATDRTITASQFIAVLKNSTLAERRPVDDLDCMRTMVAEADLTVTAWRGDELVGVARSVTDFAYCCYLSDLAVDASCQRQGVGEQLIQLTRQQLGPKCKLILLSAPDAQAYYPKVGFWQHPSAWVMD